jgi:glycosyltransferase involved in cell wall biosynthesis
MRIIRIIPQLDFGGVEQVLANSIPDLSQIKGMEVLVIVLGIGGRVEETLVRRGVQVKVLNQNPKIPNLRLLVTLISMIAKIKPDVVHCQSAEANFHGLIAARLAGVSVRVGEEIGFPNHHSYWRYIFWFVYKNATKVIAISQAVKDWIVDLGEVEAEKVEVVYNPVSLGERLKGKDGRANLEETLRFAQGDGEKPFVFVTTCRLVPVKNLGRLLDAFARLTKEFPDKSIELWIVGDGPLREVLENQSKELVIADKVKFWGFQGNIFPFLKKADVFVLPSLSEGSSVSLVEAMYVGLPSIVTQVGGTPEIIGKSEAAFFIDPQNEDSIVKALFYFLNHSNYQREVIGLRAIKESKRFSVENYLNKLLNIYSNRST